ncbi:recombinase RecF (plasmid) [Herbaspirillum seropedicae]|uniref:AAA family ATPase n=1 Tax=Herbaspirillum seropedicae TaxID=964 RepID=UPI00111F4AD6|nr:AAA family ATPase [Herbaspirillum seropedicae]QDD62678.1 recombinase RecF [Herbaspirillum seropedicae]
MKISHIQVDNILGVRTVDIKLPTPVALIAGRNGSGKSSIQEAVRMAISGEVVRAKLKKEYPALVHAGSKAGGVLVGLDDGRSYAFNLPKGQAQISDGLPTGAAIGVALNGQRFAAMKDDERRSFLFAVSGCKLSGEEIKKRLLGRNLNPQLVEMVMPVLRTGFPAGKDFAAEEARKKKGAWQQITGANWGGVASEGWAADKPTVPAVAHTTEDVAKLRQEIDQINKQIGEARAKQQAQAQAKQRRTELQELSKKAPDISGYLKKAEEELAQYEPQVVAMRQRAAGGRPLGLVHDLAYALHDLREVFPVPSTGEDDVPYQVANAALDAYEHAHGEIKPAGEADTEAQNSLPEYERGLEVLKNRATNLKRDFDAATGADQRLAELEAQTDFETDHGAGVQELEQRLGALRTSLAKMTEEIEAAAGAQRDFDAADARTAEAAKVHDEVKAWLAVADACAPDGIPSELLAEALLPVNSALTASAAFSGWASVYIDQDMAITAGKRPYALLSESEQWRVDAMIAQAVAQVTGLRLLMLDRFDVLDLQGRSDAINWLHSLSEEGHIETALVFGTLKQLPAQLPPTFTSFWIANGVIEALREAA